MTGDHAEHHLLDRPRERPVRTALGVATITFYAVLFLAGGSDLLATTFEVSLNRLTWTFRFLVLVAPPAAGYVAWRICRDLTRGSDPSPPTVEMTETTGGAVIERG